LENARPHETREHRGLGHAWILVAFTVLLAAAFVLWATLTNAHVFSTGLAANSLVALRP
jgi:hypothetical protein